MKKYFGLIACTISSICCLSNDSLSVCSPSGKICVKVWLEKNLKYRVYENNIPVLEPSDIDMLLQDKESIFLDNKIASFSIKKINDQIISPVPEKRKVIADHYNLLAITFKKNCKADFRVYDDGMAYRIITTFRDTITINDEIAEFRFPFSPDVYFPAIHKRDDADIFHTSYEELFTQRQMDKIGAYELAFNPVLVSPKNGPKIGITESDLEDYPGMFLSGTSSNSLKGKFAPYPLEEKLTTGDYPQPLVTRRADYIAKTKGARTFPWRVLIIADEDRDLPSNDIVYRLA